MLMFGWDFEVDDWSRFWRWNLIKICVWTCNMTLARWTQPLGPLCLWQCLTRKIEYIFFLLSVVLSFIVSVQGVEDLARPEVWRRGKRDAGECLPPHHHHHHHKHQHHCPPPNHHYHHHYHQHHHHCHHSHYINAGACCQRQVWQGGVVA